MGIKLCGKANQNKYKTHEQRDIRTTKWACPATIHRLGITNDFDLLCNNVGIREFVFQDVPTYRRLTMGFLRTLEHTVDIYPGDNSVEERIKFQLMDRSFDMSINEWCNCFGFAYSDGHTRTSNYLLKPQPIHYFSQISIQSNTPKGGNIECPAIRYFFYVSANTLQAGGEFTRVNEDEMLILAKAAQVDTDITPNLGTMLLFHLTRQAHQHRGPITCGGVITVLANSLGVDLSSLA